jgi:hypothetical protein
LRRVAFVRPRDVVRVLVVAVISASILVGCGSDTGSPSRPAAPNQKRDIGQRARGGEGQRICGWLSAGGYTASQIEMVGLTCRKAASLVREYIRAGHRSSGGWNGRRRCGYAAGAPGGTGAGCFVKLVNAKGQFVSFVEGGSRKLAKPPPALVNLQPGDGREL